MSLATISVAASLVEFFEVDGITRIMEFRGILTPGNQPSFEISVPFLARNGLVIKTGSNVSCTVFYSSGGA